ncbi:MAG: metallophosphoesterase [Acidobacteria bacterium]|nr:metallophosphoesterase [Acidobacteriota bacterium]
MRGVFRTGLATLVAAAICAAAALVRSPYLQNVSAEGATILWSTNEKGQGEIRYSADGDLSRAVAAQIRELLPSATSRPEYQYQAELRGLSPGREYLYRVLVDGVILKDGLRFRAAGPGPFAFLVFGDSGTGGPNQASLARRMMDNENPALVLHTGDLSQESGTFGQIESNYFSVYAPLMSRSPFFPTPGNHDYYTDSGAPYLAMDSPPATGVPAQDAGRYYSFDWGNVHFISLNSNLLESPAAAQRMLEWLDLDLERQDRFWKVAYFHHPPYPTGHHLRDPISAMVRERVVPILERRGVQLVLSGHEHSYERTVPLRNGAPADAGSGTVYIVTGGGGGALQDIGPSPTQAFGASVFHYLRGQVQGSRLTVTAIGLDGREIDRVTLAPPSRISAEAVVNAGSFAPALAPGSLITIFGRDLAVEEGRASTPPLPTELAGTTVSLNGRRLPLLFVSGYRIDAQLPYGPVGQATLRVNTPNSSAEAQIVTAEVAPAIVNLPDSFDVAPAVVRSSGGTLVSAASPASGGEAVTVYLVGLGPVDGDIAAGDPAPGQPPLRALYPVEVRIGGASVTPDFAGLTPGFAGLYQVNVRIPEALPAGIHALSVVVNGIGSDPVSLFVGPAGSSGK